MTLALHLSLDCLVFMAICLFFNYCMKKDVTVDGLIKIFLLGLIPGGLFGWILFFFAWILLDLMIPDGKIVSARVVFHWSTR